MSKTACVVCGSPVYPDSSKHIIFRGRVIHFKCERCLEYFLRDSNRFIREGADHNPCEDGTGDGRQQASRRR